ALAMERRIRPPVNGGTTLRPRATVPEARRTAALAQTRRGGVDGSSRGHEDRRAVPMPSRQTPARPDAGWRQGRASPPEAGSTVGAGDRVFVGSACGAPRPLVDALERWDERPGGVVLVHFLTDRVGRGDPPSSLYRHRVFYVGGDVRALIGSA